MIFYSHANKTHFNKKIFALFRNLEKASIVYCSDCIAYGSLITVTLKWHGTLFLDDSRFFKEYYRLNYERERFHEREIL